MLVEIHACLSLGCPSRGWETTGNDGHQRGQRSVRIARSSPIAPGRRPVVITHRSQPNNAGNASSNLVGTANGDPSSADSPAATHFRVIGLGRSSALPWRRSVGGSVVKSFHEMSVAITGRPAQCSAVNETSQEQAAVQTEKAQPSSSDRPRSIGEYRERHVHVWYASVSCRPDQRTLRPHVRA